MAWERIGLQSKKILGITQAQLFPKLITQKWIWDLLEGCSRGHGYNLFAKAALGLESPAMRSLNIQNFCLFHVESPPKPERVSAGRESVGKLLNQHLCC